MKKNKLLLIVVSLLIISCEKSQEPEKDKIHYKQEMTFMNSDSLFVLTYQNEGELRYYWNALNPEYVTLMYTLKFSQNHDYICLTFHTEFKIDDLENENKYFMDLKNEYGGLDYWKSGINNNLYILTELESMKLLEEKSIIINHTSDFSGTSVTYAQVTMDEESPYEIDQNIFSSSENQNGTIEITEISRVSDNNFTTDTGGLNPNTFELFDFVYHIKGKISTQLVNENTGEIINITEGEFKAFYYNIE